MEERQSDCRRACTCVLGGRWAAELVVEDIRGEGIERCGQMWEGRSLVVMQTSSGKAFFYRSKAILDVLCSKLGGNKDGKFFEKYISNTSNCKVLL